MLRPIVCNMLSARAVFFFFPLFSSVFAQSYVLQDDYTVANFFDMFSFYTVSRPVIGFVHKFRLTNCRVMILQMAMFNM
jgi:hypothetical protein